MGVFEELTMEQYLLTLNAQKHMESTGVAGTDVQKTSCHKEK